MRRPVTLRRRGQSGFTLLEVLLAFVVFAVSFAVVMEILSSAMRGTVRAREYTEAALVAQSVMDLVGREIPLEQLRLDGESMGDYRWSLDIYLLEAQEDYQRRVVDIADTMATEIYQVDLVLEWGDGALARSKRFSTVRAQLARRG